MKLFLLNAKGVSLSYCMFWPHEHCLAFCTLTFLLSVGSLLFYGIAKPQIR